MQGTVSSNRASQISLRTQSNTQNVEHTRYLRRDKPIRRIKKGLPKIQSTELTLMQHEIVELAILGLTSLQIADRLNTTRSTVSNNMSNIFYKLGARDRLELAKRREAEYPSPQIEDGLQIIFTKKQIETIRLIVESDSPDRSKMQGLQKIYKKIGLENHNLVSLFNWATKHRKLWSCVIEDSKPLLSETEHRIVALVREGLTNKQIGLEIGFVEGSVKNRVRMICFKLGFGNRVELTMWREAQDDQNHQNENVEDSKLTSKEKELVILLLQGYNIKEIATALHTSYQVARNNTHHLYDKLGLEIHNKSSLAIWGMRNKIE
jgi:DNA-binding NarL/FixJ family response regulator